MRHPTDGVLRRLVDEPAGVADDTRAHVTGCGRCSAGLSAARADAVAAATALSPADGGEVDVAAAWRRLPAASPVGRTAPHRAGRARALLRRPAVGALAVAVVLGGAGTAAAMDWLQVFRTERVVAVGIDPSDLVALPDLSAFGDLEVSGEDGLREVPDAATAAAQSGLDVPEVAGLPRGVVGDPTYAVAGEVTATFTFSPERAAGSLGEDLPTPPPGLEGSALRLTAGPGVAQVWSSSAGLPALVVGRAVSPQGFSSGVPFPVARDYLLSLPGLPAETAAALRAYTADGGTLVLPVPADEVRTSTAQVGGAPATVLETRDRALAAVVWAEDGMLTVVAGSLDVDEVLAVAQGLR